MPQFPFSSRGKMLTAALNADPVKSGEAYDVPAISQGLDDEQIHEDEHSRERFRKPSTTYLEYKGFNGVANYDVVLNSVIVCL